jgi:hypothetical protein
MVSPPFTGLSDSKKPVRSSATAPQRIHPWMYVIL